MDLLINFMYLHWISSKYNAQVIISGAQIAKKHLPVIPQPPLNTHNPTPPLRPHVIYTVGFLLGLPNGGTRKRWESFRESSEVSFSLLSAGFTSVSLQVGFLPSDRVANPHHSTVCPFRPLPWRWQGLPIATGSWKLGDPLSVLITLPTGLQ